MRGRFWRYGDCEELVFLRNSSQYKDVKVRPIAIVVKATGDTWTPVRVYYGNMGVLKSE